jgi:hypothetical protein
MPCESETWSGTNGTVSNKKHSFDNTTRDFTDHFLGKFEIDGNSGGEVGGDRLVIVEVD